MTVSAAGAMYRCAQSDGASRRSVRMLLANPQVVRISTGIAGHRLAAVARPERADVQRPDGVLVLRVGGDVRVVERALADVATRVRQLPRRPCVVGAEEAAV